MHIIKYIGFLLIISTLTLVQGKGLKVYYNVTDKEYDEMPQLFKLDDYDKCMNTPNTLYCYTTVQLGPVNQSTPSRVWNIIQEVISVPRTYRHDRIRHGICVPSTCPGVPNTHYQVGSNVTQPLLDALAKCFSDKYNHLGLQGHVIKIHCENETPFHQIDQLDMIYAWIVLSFLALVVASSFYEGFARFLEPSKYEELTTKSALGRFITCFSLPKNWERLRSELKTPDAEALAPIQGVRVFNMIFVVLSHTAMLVFLVPVINPKFNEAVTLRVENMFISNGSLICQTFLIISGWLLTYSFCVMFENKKIEYKHLVMAFANRLFRLVPIIVLIIGFSATWLRHLGRGPVWELVTGADFKNCRKNWIWNLLFLQNYINPHEMCLQQTWYIAADMQTFIVGIFIMMYVINNPKRANKVFGFFMFLGVLITFVQHYYNSYDIVFRSWPEIVHSLCLEYDEWLYVFVAGHNNFSCYVLGLACGFYFHKFRKEKKFPLIKSKLGLLLWTLYAYGGTIGTILIASLFYQEGYEQTRFGAALYQATSKMMFGVPIALTIFGMTFGVGWHMISVCKWAPLQYLGRLSFSAYLVHVAPLRVKSGLIRSPIYVSYYDIIYSTIGDIAVSYLCATMLCLLFEMPLSALQKLIFSGPPKTDNKQKISEKTE